MLSREAVVNKILSLANEILEETGDMETAEEIVKVVNYKGYGYDFADEEDNPHFEIFPRCDF